VTFPSAFVTPHPENNIVRCRYFPARDSKTAVLVLPHWNANPILRRLVPTARLEWHERAEAEPALHDERTASRAHRADFIVSANVARTCSLPAGVLDARRAIAWLASAAATASGSWARVSGRASRF